MIVLHKPLPSLTFSRNLNVIRFRVTDGTGYPYRAYGSRSFLVVPDSSTGMPSGGTITVEYNDADTGLPVTVTLTAPADLPVNTGAISAPYMAELFGAVGGHPDIAPFLVGNTYYDGTNYVLLLEGRDRGYDHEVTITNSKGWAVLGPNAPSGTTAPENLSAAVDVFFEPRYKAGGWQRVARLSIQPDEEGFVAADIEGILTREWDAARYKTDEEGVYAQPVDDVYSASAFVADNRRRYYVRYGERGGSPIVTSSWMTTDQLVAMDGGVVRRLWADGGYSVSGVMGTALARNLLSWRPNKRWVSERQPAWMSFLNSGDTDISVSLEYTTINDIGAQSAWLPGGASLLIEGGASVTFPVGALALSIDTSTVRSYLVRFVTTESGGAPRPSAEVVQYYIDCLYRDTLRFLVWRNSFGVIEDLRCIGHYAYAQDVSRSTASRPLAFNYNRHFADRVQFDVEDNRIRTYRTGYMSREEVTALMDMVAVNDVWEVQPDGSLCALMIVSDKFRVYDTRDFLYSLEFEAYTRLRTQNHGEEGDWSEHTVANNVIPSPSSGFWITGDPENWEDGSGNPWQYGG